MSLVSIFMTNRAHGWRNDRTGNDSNCFVQRISGDFDFADISSGCSGTSAKCQALKRCDLIFSALRNRQSKGRDETCSLERFRTECKSNGDHRRERC